MRPAPAKRHTPTDIAWAVEALHGAKIIDELLCLMTHDNVDALDTPEWDYHIVDEALRFVAQAAQVPGQPVTVSLAHYLRQRGLLSGLPPVDQDSG
jgi:hypothetical protein